MGEGRWIVEAEQIGDLAHRLIRVGEQCTGFVKGKVCEMFTDSIVRDFFHHTRKIGGGDTEFVGIILYLSLLPEVLGSQVHENLEDIALMSGIGYWVVFSCAEAVEEEEHVMDKRSQHFAFIGVR